MIKKIFFLTMFIALTSFTDVPDVYICKSKNGKKYHLKEDCRGLKACRAEISKVTLKEAKDQGKTLCGFED